MQFNTQAALSELYKTKLGTNAPPLARKVELKRLRKAEQGKKRRQVMKQNKIVRTPFCRVKQSGSGYGPNCEQPDLSPENFDTEKRVHFENLSQNHENRVSIETNTHKKQQCNLWNEIVPKMVLSQDFGSTCKARSRERNN